jgi:hypothetical protein
MSSSMSFQYHYNYSQSAASWFNPDFAVAKCGFKTFLTGDKTADEV